MKQQPGVELEITECLSFQTSIFDGDGEVGPQPLPPSRRPLWRAAPATPAARPPRAAPPRLHDAEGAGGWGSAMASPLPLGAASRPAARRGGGWGEGRDERQSGGGDLAGFLSFTHTDSRIYMPSRMTHIPIYVSTLCAPASSRPGYIVFALVT
jgi:hypothetical protein